MPQCKHPNCDVVFNQPKYKTKQYCTREHYRDHQKLLRKGTDFKATGPQYSFIDPDLAERFAAIDARIMEEDEKD